MNANDERLIANEIMHRLYEAKERGQLEILHLYAEAAIKKLGGLGWIPCTERLPEHDTLVRFLRHGVITRGFFICEEAGFPYFTGGGCRYWYPSENVTHWMPDPDPALP
jgi:hypothetical protein